MRCLLSCNHGPAGPCLGAVIVGGTRLRAEVATIGVRLNMQADSATASSGTLRCAVLANGLLGARGLLG